MTGADVTGSPRPRLVVVAGPTAVGKTAVSLALAEKFGGEIINADSMQIYRYMDIGTAKPTLDEQKRAVHHLIDIVHPDQDFDAAAYLRLARPVVADIDRRGLVPVVVGGTGLYLRSLVGGLFKGPGRDEAIRARLKTEAEQSGRDALHARLAMVDPTAATRIHPNDLVRVVRALEVFEITGRPISDFQAEHGLAEEPYEVLYFFLHLPREILYERINRRTSAMFDAGLPEEVRGLLDRGYSPDLKPLQSIGYKETVAYLRGRLTLSEAVRDTARNTRRYAKRQLTWHRDTGNVVRLMPGDLDRIMQITAEFLRRSSCTL